MVTRKKATLTLAWSTPDWKLYECQRVLVLWQVAALSLDAEPDLKNVERAKQDVQFNVAYARRKKILGRMLSVEPLDGHVTYFPWHEYNKDKRQSSNRMVDVVSCIEKLLKFENEKLPPDFVALRDPLVQIPLPKDTRSRGELVLSPNITIVTSSARPESTADASKQTEGVARKKDQSKAIASKTSEQLAAMFYAVVCDAYGYDATSDLSHKLTVDAVEKALLARGIANLYGLSSTKIKEALRVGKEQCPPVKT